MEAEDQDTSTRKCWAQHPQRPEGSSWYGEQPCGEAHTARN
ncbi:hypothetical protein PRBEI_2000990800 [Prionailurus iriomotensis]